MIPTGDESCETRLTTDEQFNINRSNSTTTWTFSYAADCAEDNGNQVDEKFQSVTSRTDKPRLAHEVYWHWMRSVGPFGNHNIMCNKAPTFPLNKNDLLIAAYSGSSLMFRKWNNCDFEGKEQSSRAATFGGIKNGLMAHHFIFPVWKHISIEMLKLEQPKQKRLHFLDFIVFIVWKRIKKYQKSHQYIKLFT